MRDHSAFDRRIGVLLNVGHRILGHGDLLSHGGKRDVAQSGISAGPIDERVVFCFGGFVDRCGGIF